VGATFGHCYQTHRDKIYTIPQQIRLSCFLVQGKSPKTTTQSEFVPRPSHLFYPPRQETKKAVAHVHPIRPHITTHTGSGGGDLPAKYLTAQRTPKYTPNRFEIPTGRDPTLGETQREKRGGGKRGQRPTNDLQPTNHVRAISASVLRVFYNNNPVQRDLIVENLRIPAPIAPPPPEILVGHTHTSAQWGGERSMVMRRRDQWY